MLPNPVLPKLKSGSQKLGVFVMLYTSIRSCSLRGCAQRQILEDRKIQPPLRRPMHQRQPDVARRELWSAAEKTLVSNQRCTVRSLEGRFGSPFTFGRSPPFSVPALLPVLVREVALTTVYATPDCRYAGAIDLPVGQESMRDAREVLAPRQLIAGGQPQSGAGRRTAACRPTRTG